MISEVLRTKYIHVFPTFEAIHIHNIAASSYLSCKLNIDLCAHCAAHRVYVHKEQQLKAK